MQTPYTFKLQLVVAEVQLVELTMIKQVVNQQELEEVQERMFLIKYFLLLKVRH
jgi:hypothetical protein